MISRYLYDWTTSSRRQKLRTSRRLLIVEGRAASRVGQEMIPVHDCLLAGTVHEQVMTGGLK